jgi:hypothetical protein
MESNEPEDPRVQAKTDYQRVAVVASEDGALGAMEN